MRKEIKGSESSIFSVIFWNQDKVNSSDLIRLILGLILGSWPSSRHPIWMPVALVASNIILSLRQPYMERSSCVSSCAIYITW